MTPNKDIEIYRGDDEVYEMTITRSGAALDITGSKLWFTAKNSITDLDSAAVIKKDTTTGDITIMSGVGNLGKFQIAFEPTDTAAIVPPATIADKDKFEYVNTLYYDVQLKLLATGKVYTVVRGRLLVLPDITQTTT